MVEQFKIEDEIFPKFDVEKEHMLQLSREIEDEKWFDISQTQDTTNNSILSEPPQDDLKQPVDLPNWPEQ